jgi:hypothetical protein
MERFLSFENVHEIIITIKVSGLWAEAQAKLGWKSE